MSDEEPAQRRGPRQRPSLPELPADDLAPEEFPDEDAGPLEVRGIRRLAATRVAGVAFVGVVVVVIVGLLLGDAEDLPWGAIIIVLVLIAAIYVVGRRRQLPPE